MSWDNLPSLFEAQDGACAAREQRRLPRVLRQLELRIAEVDALHAEIARNSRIYEEESASLKHEAENWRRQYEALLATKTMRALRLPRTLYAGVRNVSAGLKRSK